MAEHGDDDQAEEEQQEQLKDPKLHAKIKRILVTENVKRSDIAPWDRNDKKTSWQAWRMQTNRILKDSNISSKRQISFILGALQGGSAAAILASWGPDGPPSDLAIESFWAHLDSLFAPEESNFQRDNRFKAFKLGDFSSIALFLERYQDEMAKCTAPPADDYRLGVLATAVQEIPIIAFQMEKWLSAQTPSEKVMSFLWTQELRKCEALLPKKTTMQPAAAVASADADEDLLQKLAAKIAVIQGRTG